MNNVISDKKVLHEYLARKGYHFSEDIDLAQLDRMHRKIPDLAATPAAKPKKKRRPDIFRILEGEDVADVADVADSEQESLAVGTHKRLSAEQSRLAKASMARETSEWEEEFRLRREELDDVQNAQFKDLFIRRAKHIYADVSHSIHKKRQV